MPAPESARKMPAWGVPAIVIALVVLGALALIVSGSGDGERSAEPTPAASPSTPDQASAAADLITSIPAQTFDQAGVDAVDPGAFVELPASEPALEKDGKPEVLYIGAEYCPFCAGQRWALIAAMSRFGEFSGLEESYSALDDVYPGTKTFSFYGSDFASDHVAFTPVETATNERSGQTYAPLQAPTPEQEQIVRKYDAPPYAQGVGAIPFLDMGNRFIVIGSTVPVEPMQGLSTDQIAEQAVDPDTEIGATVLGSANVISAIVCEQTGGEPADVCSSAGVRAGAEALGL